MKLLLLTSLLVILVAPWYSLARSPETSPRDFADRFYRTYLQLKISGLPDSKQYQELSPFLSTDLQRLFMAARQEQAKAIKENPNEKPPWGDGDLLTSLFEGAQTFRIGEPRKRGKYTEVPVYLEYQEGGSTTRWEDALLLVQTSKGWRVWDILLKGEWQFKSGSSLRKVLGAK